MRKMRKLLKRSGAIVLAGALTVTLVPVTAAAETSGGDETWVATPYHKETGELAEGVEEAVAGKEYWLESTEAMPVTVEFDDNSDSLIMSNGIIDRSFHIPEKGEHDFYTETYNNLYIEKELLGEEIVPEVYLGLYDKPYHEIYEGQTINLQPDYYYVGGIESENTFVFDGYEVFDECEKPFEWSPHPVYGDPAVGDWPPAGKRIEVSFSAPDSFPEGYQGIKIKLIYEMYDKTPVVKKRVEVTNTGDGYVTVGKIAPEVLNGNENMDELVMMESDYTCGDQSTIPFNEPLPCGCTEEQPESAFSRLTEYYHSCYEIGPGYELVKDQTFKTFNTYEFVYSTYWFELKARERLQIYRTLFPWITDNPLTFHNTTALTKEIIDHAAEAGYELIIQSFSAPDSTKQMLSRDQAVMDQFKELVDYAHEKNVDIGAYQAQYTRSQYKGGAAYGTNDIGQWNTWCMASAAFDDYWDNFKYFVKYTGLDAVEIDGTYPGCACDNGEEHVNADRETDPDPEGTDKETGDASKYAVHNGYFDSVVKQWENAVQMLSHEMKEMGVYINVPAWYYMNGGNKCGIGYEEIAWSQPRHEQQLYARQLIHNASYARTMSMSWTHVPFAVYHGGGSDAAYTPFKDNIEDYNWILGQYLGNGVNAVFRGPALYDEETLSIIQKWVAFSKKYRGIANSDIVHINQAKYDSQDTDRDRTVKMDTLYHANANNPGEKGLLWVYNQTDETRTETITVPMYYTGLTNMAYPAVPLKGSLGEDVHAYGEWPPNYSWLPDQEGNYTLPEVTGESTGTASFAKEGVEVTDYTIDSNGNVKLEVTLPPMSFTYYAIYPEGEAPQTEVSVGKVTGLKAGEVTDRTIELSWDKDVDLTVIEDGETDTNPAVTVEKYQIFRNGELIGESRTNSYTDTELDERTGYTYSVKAVAAGISGESSDEISVETMADTEKPYVINVLTTGENSALITFNEAVNQETAEDIENYTVSEDIIVESAVLQAENQVELSFEALETLKNYKLTIKGIKDISLDENVMDESSHNLVYGYVSRYLMENIDENILHDEIGNYPGTVSNVTLTDSPFGKGIEFNAEQSSYADLGSGQLNDLETYSVNVWVKTDQPQRQVVLSQGQENMTSNDFTIYTENNEVVFRTSNSDGSAEVQLTDKENFVSGQWNQIAVTRDKEEFALYVNGIKSDSETVSGVGVFDHTNMLYLGTMKNHAGGDRTMYFTGTVANLSVYRISLTEEQIQMLFDENTEEYQVLSEECGRISAEFYTKESYEKLGKAVAALEEELTADNPSTEAIKTAAEKVQTERASLEKKQEYQSLEAGYDLTEESGGRIIDGMTGRAAEMTSGDYMRMNTPFGYGLFISDVRQNYVTIPENPLSGKADFTISGWFKAQPKQGDEQELAGKQVLYADAEGKLIIYILNGVLYCSIFDDSGETVMEASEGIKYDTINGETRQAWNHFALTRSGTSFVLYQNGTEVAQAEKDMEALPENAAYIGASLDSAGNVNGVFNGIVNYFRFYNNAISIEQIASIQEEIKFVKAEENNIALNKELYSDSMDDAFRLNDGKILDMAGTDTPWTARKNGVESVTYRIDLGDTYLIDAFSFANFYRPYGQANGTDQAGFRRYVDMVIQVSSTRDFSTDVTTIYNSDAENRLGQGNGTDPTQVAFELGNDVILEQPVVGRYVRMITRGFYMENGRYLNNANVAELEIYGSGVDEVKQELQELIDTAKGLDEILYTEESYNAVKEAVSKAETALSDGDSNTMSEAKEALEKALEELEYKTVDKEKLQQLHDTWKDEAENGYIKETWDLFKDALEKAETVLNAPNAAQAEIDAAYESLQTAIEGLRVSKSTLEYFLNSAKEHAANGDTEGLVESVQKLFEEAIAEGEAVMADENAAKEEVTNAAIKLMKAIQALDFKAGDKTDLEMALDLAEMIDLTKYVEEGQAEYLEAKETAESVMADGDAMQDEVNAAWNALADAMNNLRLKANKDALQDLLDSLEGLDLSLYTEESVQIYNASLAKASAVLADETLSVDKQDEVNTAVKALSDAKEQLVLKEESQGGSKDGNSGMVSHNSVNKAAKTGDNMNPAVWAAILGVTAVIAGAVSVKKRKQVK